MRAPVRSSPMLTFCTLPHRFLTIKNNFVQIRTERFRGSARPWRHRNIELFRGKRFLPKGGHHPGHQSFDLDPQFPYRAGGSGLVQDLLFDFFDFSSGDIFEILDLPLSRIRVEVAIALST